jgi:DNA-binding transcriptional regulator YiaG
METTMTKHERPKGASIGEDRVLDKKQAEARERTLAKYDATVHVGLRTVVCHAAIERVNEEGEETIELPKPRVLRASAAMVRCLMPIRLRGNEIKAIRKIMGLTLSDLAKKLDERTAVETVSRWESEAQPMGGYAEKVLRLLVCEELKSEAPGIEYNGSMIAHLNVKDPWRENPDFVVPYVILRLIRMKEQSGSIIETWNSKIAA